MLWELSPVLSDLEVRLLQDADELVGCLAPVCDRAELLEDVLDKLHVVLPHSLELGFLKLLVSLGFNEYKTSREGIPLALLLSEQLMHHAEL